MRKVISRGILLCCIAAAASSGLAPVAPAKAAAPFGKLNHIVVLMQENRSFDNYLGHLAAFDPTLGVEPEPTTGNQDAAGQTVVPFHQTSYCESADLDHSWTGAHNEWNGGLMNNFVRQNAVAADPTGSRAMGYYDQTDLPYYYDLFDHFAISDTYFSGAIGPTYPNRWYLLSATSFGHTANDIGTNPQTDYSQLSIFDELTAAGVSWKIYFSEVPFAVSYANVRNSYQAHLAPVQEFTADSAAGTLPQVAFVDPFFIGEVNTENDGHPPSNVQHDQQFVSGILASLFTSPNWADSAAFLTYDEDGGYYDHVAPPAAAVPDSFAPVEGGAFDHTGFRVPFAVISPFSKPHHVSSALPEDTTNPANPVFSNPAHIYSHTSITRTIEERFGLPAMTARDASSNDLSDLFDFSAPALATPPALAAATIDAQHQVACENQG
ncbi:MAG: phospholipase C [Candidatus Dormibacteria bacterium]